MLVGAATELDKENPVGTYEGPVYAVPGNTEHAIAAHLYDELVFAGLDCVVRDDVLNTAVPTTATGDAYVWISYEA